MHAYKTSFFVQTAKDIYLTLIRIFYDKELTLVVYLSSLESGIASSCVP